MDTTYREGKLRVLLSAYACEPDKGSEPGAGWQIFLGWIRAGAHVTLVTRSRNLTKVLRAAENELPSETYRVIGVDFGSLVLALKRWLPFADRWYYFLWQLKARAIFRSLALEYGFDLAHHATYAVDWMPSGLSVLAGRAPIIWGPVGGATRIPKAMARFASWKGRAFELLRVFSGGLGRIAVGRSIASTVDLAVLQNGDEVNALGRFARRYVVEPNVYIAESLIVKRRHVDRYSLVGVGRLVELKGWELAIEALVLTAPEFQLTIYGEGPNRPRLKELAVRLGVADRVNLVGAVSRETVMAALSSAHCLVAPSLHDAAGAAVAEALSSGCPAVVLDIGGPAILVREAGGSALDPNSASLTWDLASAMMNPPPVADPQRWTADRLPAMLTEWAAVAQESSTLHRARGEW